MEKCTATKENSEITILIKKAHYEDFSFTFPEENLTSDQVNAFLRDPFGTLEIATNKRNNVISIERNKEKVFIAKKVLNSVEEGLIGINVSYDCFSHVLILVACEYNYSLQDSYRNPNYPQKLGY